MKSLDGGKTQKCLYESIWIVCLGYYHKLMITSVGFAFLTFQMDFFEGKNLFSISMRNEIEYLALLCV